MAFGLAIFAVGFASGCTVADSPGRYTTNVPCTPLWSTAQCGSPAVPVFWPRSLRGVYDRVGAGVMMENSALRESLAFRLAWLMGSGWLHLSAGRTIRSLPPAGPEAAFHYPVIIRLPPAVAASMMPGLERLRALDPHHYYYPAKSMHITVNSVGRFLSGSSDVMDRVAELRAVIGSYPSFDVALCGLNVSPTTVFAQVVPDGGAFGCLRKGLKTLNYGPGKVDGIGGVLRDLLPHANVVRLSGRVTVDFLEEISGSRRAWFGRWTVREVELVRTDRLLSREGSRVLERIPLATP